MLLQASSSRQSAFRRLMCRRPRLFPAFVAKMRQALTFSATIGTNVDPMKTITVITILALLTISGAVISDQILTGQEHLSQTKN